jgi:hypothetical protein
MTVFGRLLSPPESPGRTAIGAVRHLLVSSTLIPIPLRIQGFDSIARMRSS